MLNSKSETYTRRDFLKTGVVVGASFAAVGSMYGCSDKKEAVETSPEPQVSEPEETPEAVLDDQAAKDTIFITDMLHCAPGDGEALFNHYMDVYAPGAEERGMTLVHSKVNPPIWLTDDSANNTLEFVWSVPGMMGWANMVGASRYNPDVAPALIDFWYEIDDRVLSRTRTLSAPDTDVESLTTLANLSS